MPEPWSGGVPLGLVDVGHQADSRAIDEGLTDRKSERPIQANSHAAGPSFAVPTKRL